jgi:protein-disulfide isomerase
MVSALTALAGEIKCPELRGDAREHLKRLVRFRYGLTNDVALQVDGEPLIGCFYKARVATMNQESRFVRIFTITPDQRYVVSDFVDLEKDPAEDAVEKQKVFNQQLAPADAPIRGNAAAPVTLVVFSDFQCPYCKRASEILTAELASDSEKVRLVFRQFPLPMHDWALQAAEASACVAQQSGELFWKAHDFVFQHQSELSSAVLIDALEKKLRQSPGFNSALFQQCLQNHSAKQLVDRDIQFGLESGIRATPAVFINGVKVNWAGNPDQVKSLIRQAERGAPNAGHAALLHGFDRRAVSKTSADAAGK